MTEKWANKLNEQQKVTSGRLDGYVLRGSEKPGEF
jgi:hypothetical protein